MVKFGIPGLHSNAKRSVSYTLVIDRSNKYRSLITCREVLYIDFCVGLLIVHYTIPPFTTKMFGLVLEVA